jgi:hypothetical protein
MNLNQNKHTDSTLRIRLSILKAVKAIHSKVSDLSYRISSLGKLCHLLLLRLQQVSLGLWNVQVLRVRHIIHRCRYRKVKENKP